MRVGKDGSRSWLFYYRTKDGTQRRPKIGDADKISLGQARDLARAMAAQVTLGRDPHGELKAKRLSVSAGKQAAQVVLTVRDLYDAAYAGHWNSARFHKSGWTRRVEQMWKNSLSDLFGSKKYDAVSPAMIRSWRLQCEATPYAFNRKLEVLSSIYRFAEKDRIIPKESNPCVGIEPFTEMKRNRYATAAEIQLIWAELDREALRNPGAAAFLKLVFLTGSRPYALHGARLEHFRVVIRDEKRFGVLLSAGKGTAASGEDEMIIFPPEAMEIVDTLPKTHDGRMFEGTYPRDMWRRVRAKVGSDDLRIRDSRRTFATQGLSRGVGLSVIGELLNHSSTDMTRRYAKLMPSARMDAAEQISESIVNLLGQP